MWNRLVALAGIAAAAAMMVAGPAAAQSEELELLNQKYWSELWGPVDLSGGPPSTSAWPCWDCARITSGILIVTECCRGDGCTKKEQDGYAVTKANLEWCSTYQGQCYGKKCG